jgi:hypothetical protein
MYKHPKIDFLAAYNSRTGNGLVKNSVLPSAATTKPIDAATPTTTTPKSSARVVIAIKLVVVSFAMLITLFGIYDI